MNIKNLLKRIIDPNHYSSEAYIQYLRNSGVHIGEKRIVYAPRHTSIDIQKPHLISIGSYCKITTGSHHFGSRLLDFSGTSCVW